MREIYLTGKLPSAKRHEIPFNTSSDGKENPLKKKNGQQPRWQQDQSCGNTSNILTPPMNAVKPCSTHQTDGKENRSPWIEDQPQRLRKRNSERRSKGSGASFFLCMDDSAVILVNIVPDSVDSGNSLD
jgi:hypothetical protein